MKTLQLLGVVFLLLAGSGTLSADGNLPPKAESARPGQFLDSRGP